MPRNVPKFTDAEKLMALSTLTKHIGRQRAISMQRFYAAVFGERPADHIDGTRKIRLLVAELRRSGEPICSSSAMVGGGYYLAAAGSELDDYCARLRNQALAKLITVSRLKKISVKALCTQLELHLTAFDNTEPRS